MQVNGIEVMDTDLQTINDSKALTGYSEKDINVRSRIWKRFYYIVKRCFDIGCGIVGSIILVPLLLIVKIAYLVNGDTAPVLFKQDRIGINGKIIKIYKIRSMVHNAEQVLEELMEKDPEIRKEYLTYKKLKDDPRVTKIGKFIRKTSLDEFGQFLNVLNGTMSMIGPRPYLPREKADMEPYYNDIITCKPRNFRTMASKWSL